MQNSICGLFTLEAGIGEELMKDVIWKVRVH